MEKLLINPWLRSSKPERLSELATLIGGRLIGADRVIDRVTFDSRHATETTLFVALRGTVQDGHEFVNCFFRGGGGAVIVEAERFVGPGSGIIVENSAHALGLLARHFSGVPDSTLRVVGITGTNGKTTTNWLVYHMLKALSGRATRIGTLGTMIGEQLHSADGLTTPDALSLWSILQQGYSRGVSDIVMEVSSHALAQQRVTTIPFAVGVFTNLTLDHLDYHHTFDAYFEAKSKLFTQLAENSSGPGTAVIHLEGEYAHRLKALCHSLKVPVLTFGRAAECDVLIDSFEQEATGSTLVLKGRAPARICTPFIGAHNAENIAGAFGVGLALGFSASAIVTALQAVPEVSGRLQRVPGRPSVFVDYAHTPDALERALRALKPLSVSAKLWVIFGCGGDRDRGKRPLMGAIAAREADRVVVTSDNPRTEEPQSILDEILVGCPSPAFATVDREAAIRFAVHEAAEDDIILIAGKGHEDYQIIGREKRHFSDVEAATQALSTRR